MASVFLANSIHRILAAGAQKTFRKRSGNYFASPETVKILFRRCAYLSLRSSDARREIIENPEAGPSGY